MNKETKVIIIAVGAIALIGCLCVAVIGIGGLGLFIASSATTGAPTADLLAATPELPAVTVDPFDSGEGLPVATPTPTASSGVDEEVVPAEATPDRSTSEISPEIAAEMDEIEDQVVELRGLQPAGSVSRALLTPAQLRQRVMDDFLEDYTLEEAQEDALILSVFGLLDPDFELYDFYIELFSEQISGYYDDETKEMYVIQGEGFQGVERLTYAHEYTHALQDQNFDFQDGLNYTDEACEEDSERCAAIQALVEGDASLLEFEWFANFATAQDALEIQEFYSNYESPVYDSAPAFLKEDFLFPYTYGQSFVEKLYAEGGWRAVDQAYRDLPVTTEQIIHPEKYPDDIPLQVPIEDLTGLLGDGWEEIDRGVMGEWYTYLILALGEDPSSRIDEDDAKEASAGWDGDTYLVYSNSAAGETAMVLAMQWETDEDVDQFFEAFLSYASNRFGTPISQGADYSTWDDSNGFNTIYRDGLKTIWIAAPDSESGTAILNTLNGS